MGMPKTTGDTRGSLTWGGGGGASRASCKKIFEKVIGALRLNSRRQEDAFRAGAGAAPRFVFSRGVRLG